MNVLEHKFKDDITLVRMVAKPGKKIRSQGVLFSYRLASNPKKTLTHRATEFQVVQEVLVSSGNVANGTSIIRCKVGCLHPIIAFGLCSVCGLDLKDDESIEKQNTVSMIHAIPQVSVSESEASELGMSDIRNQLKHRKLTLVVDLDQTIIHTSTTDDIPEGIPGVFNFFLSSKRFRYSTRIRPGTEKFLDEMSKLYEMHVFTMGARDYADTITAALDPSKRFFSSRVLSRDECFDNHSKVPKLQALFPKGDKLVVIIDDRFDMWSSCPNLIRVHPYGFFEDVGDINDPRKRGARGAGTAHSRAAASNSNSSVAQFKKNKPLTREHAEFCFKTAATNVDVVNSIPKRADDGSVDFEESLKILRTLLLDGMFELSLLFLRSLKSHIKTAEVEVDKGKTGVEEHMETEEERNLKRESKEDSEDDAEKIVRGLITSEDETSSLSFYYMKYIEEGKERTEERSVLQKSSPLYRLYSARAEQDGDRYLETLSRLLRDIHAKFYSTYTPDMALDVASLPDTKEIMPQLRQVWRRYNVVFSGLIPTNVSHPKNHPVWCAALQLGANVSVTITKQGDKKTTHLVTSRADTGKVHQALKMGIPIVRPEWLWECFNEWKDVPTGPFEWEGLKKRPATKEEREEFSKSVGGEVALLDLAAQVDEALEEDDDGDEEGKEDGYGSSYSGSSSSVEELGSNDLTGAPETTRKRKRSNDNNNNSSDENSNSDDDHDSLEGSLLDELEAEFTEQLDDAADGDSLQTL